LDPVQQLMTATNKLSHLGSMEVGEPVYALGIGIVMKSTNEKYPVGNKYHFSGHWAEYKLFTPENMSFLIPVPNEIESSDFLAVGSLTTGLTAYFGLHQCCKEKIKPDNTCVVSGASGGVGQIAVQIAKLEGLRVVGITGGDKKVKDLLENYNVDAPVDYRAETFALDLTGACPNKVDIYFDNTGGEVTDTVFSLLNDNARIALCGLISSYISQKPQVFKNYFNLISTRSKIEGFLTGRDNLALLNEGSQKISEYLQKGLLKFDKTIVSLADAPYSFSLLFSRRKCKKRKIISKSWVVSFII